jgi:chromosome segregation ATPase
MDEFTKSIDSLETNLISVINELKASTEVILRELTLYLSALTREMGEVRKSTVGSESLIKRISEYIDKLDTIENKILELPNSLSEIEKTIEKNRYSLSKESTTLYRQLATYFKQVGTTLNKKIEEASQTISHQDSKFRQLETGMEFLSKALNEYKVELTGNQERMANVITELIRTKGNVDKAEIGVKKEEIKAETQKSKTEADKYKAKITLLIKIVTIIGASGGIGYLIVSAILKALGS